MPTMVVKHEVEATPELVIASLHRFAAATSELQFPFATGSLITLKPDYLKAIGGIADMPVLVMLTGKGSLLGMVAIQKADGDITVAFVGPQQVVGAYAGAAQVPASS